MESFSNSKWSIRKMPNQIAVLYNEFKMFFDSIPIFNVLSHFICHLSLYLCSMLYAR
jgi:hypothetical protein